MINFYYYAYGDWSIQDFFNGFDVDSWNGEILCLVGLGIVVEKYVHWWSGPHTKITIKDIFVTFLTNK